MPRNGPVGSHLTISIVALYGVTLEGINSKAALFSSKNGQLFSHDILDSEVLGCTIFGAIPLGSSQQVGRT